MSQASPGRAPRGGVREEAARLRARGFALCRPERRQKKPTAKGWTAQSLEPTDFSVGDQIGILTGPLSNGNRPGHALVVLDLDSRDAVRLADHYLPATGMVDGRPGKPRSHRYYLVPLDSVPNWAASPAAQAGSAATAAHGHPGPFKKQFRHRRTRTAVIDFQGTGGQVVCPPAVWEGSDGRSRERREWQGGEPGEPAVVPFTDLWDSAARLASTCGAAVPAAPHERPPSAHTPDARLERRAVEYLARMPEAVSGQGGHDRLFAAARSLVWGFNLSVEVAVRLLAGHYNPRCQPQWSEAELWHKCEDADRVPFGKPRGHLLSGDRGTARSTPEPPGAWEPPVPFGRQTPPPIFPVDVLPGWLRAFVAATAVATQTPPDAAGMLALAVVAGGLAGKVRYRIRRGWAKNANLFLVVVMDPGERKSAVFKAVLTPVWEAERAAADAARPRIAQAVAERGTLEARLKQFQARSAKVEDPAETAQLRDQIRELAAEIAAFRVPPEPRFVVDDETPENLARTLIDQDGRLLQAAAEGTAFEIAGGRYSDGENFDVYLKAHDGDPLRVGRVSRGYSGCDHPALTCGLSIQPDVLRGLGRSDKARGRGFLARWLYAVPAARVGGRVIRPEPVPPAVTAAYEAGVRRFWGLPVPTEPMDLPFDPAADDALAAFEATIEPRLGAEGDLHGLAAWGTKLAGEVARLAGTIHVAGSANPAAPDPVGRPAVDAAVRLASEYLIPHARRAFGLMNADPAEALAVRVLRHLARRPDLTQTSRRELLQGLKGGQTELKADDLTPALDLLVENGYLRHTPSSGTPGRPSERYDVNPLWDRPDSAAVIPQIPRNQCEPGVSGELGE